MFDFEPHHYGIIEIEQTFLIVRQNFMRYVLHSDLNNFYASVECAKDPTLRGQPIAVCGDPEARHGIVLAKSEQAKKLGNLNDSDDD